MGSVILAGFLPKFFDGMVSEEPSHLRERPHLVEASKATPRRNVEQQQRFTIYRNQWTPLPEDIPLGVRFSRAANNSGASKSERVSPSAVNRVMISRTSPKSYSDQIMEDASA